MARNDKRVQVTLECQTCKRRNYITTKNKVNDRERIEMKKYCRWDRRTPCTRRRADPSRRATPRGRSGRGPVLASAPAAADVGGASPGAGNRHGAPPTTSPMPTDTGCAGRPARDGDRRAFDELVRATYVDTYTLAHRLTGDEEDARDVVQETYLRAYRGLARFRGDAQFTTWLYRITANCASTHLGRRRSAPPRRAGRRHPPRRPRPAHDPRAGPSTWRSATRLQWALRAGSPPACGPSWCCATSTTCPTRPSPPSSASPRPPPRCGCTGPGAASATELYPDHALARSREARMRCERWPTLLAGVADGSSARRAGSGATWSSACGARPSWCSTGASCGRCAPCAPRCSSPTRACSPRSSPPSRQPAGERQLIRLVMLYGAAGRSTCGGPGRLRPPRPVPPGAFVVASRHRRASRSRSLPAAAGWGRGRGWGGQPTVTGPSRVLTCPGYPLGQ
jgi:ribosomal protein L33